MNLNISDVIVIFIFLLLPIYLLHDRINILDKKIQELININKEKK